MAAFKRSLKNSACINLDAHKSSLFPISQTGSQQTVHLLHFLQRFLPALGEGCFIICGDLCISGPSFTLIQVKLMNQNLLSQRITNIVGNRGVQKQSRAYTYQNGVGYALLWF
jgi:hypothetical protein